jgi:hypothetical protein
MDMQGFLTKQRKNRFLPKGIYLHDIKGKYPKFRAALKVNGKVKTVRYSYNLYEACEAFIIAHEDYYGIKPYWYKEFQVFYKKQSQPLSF